MRIDRPPRRKSYIIPFLGVRVAHSVEGVPYAFRTPLLKGDHTHAALLSPASSGTIGLSATAPRVDFEKITSGLAEVSRGLKLMENLCRGGGTNPADIKNQSKFIP
jgi:hypothetical protein